MKKILLIEDDQILRENTEEVLQLEGYDVLSHQDGIAGIEAARNFKPDVILCDIMMPEMDGYSVINVLSRDPSTSDIPFIFLTAKSEKKDVRKGMSLGADDYLTKPYEESDLLSSISARLKKSISLKQHHPTTSEGLSNYFDTVHEVTGIEGLYQERTPRTYKKKESVFLEGDTPQHLYMLSSGKVKIFKTHVDGKEYTTRLIDAGEFFGHLPIMESKNYTETAQAMTSCEICRIPKSDFLTLLEKNVYVGCNFIKLITKDLLEVEKKLLSLAYDTVRKRTADALLELKEKYGKEDEPAFNIDISRTDIASMVGTAPESVIRTLSDFKEERLIRVNGKNIELLNEKGLKSIW